MGLAIACNLLDNAPDLDDFRWSFVVHLQGVAITATTADGKILKPLVNLPAVYQIYL
jgi:hypothetical protein